MVGHTHPHTAICVECNAQWSTRHRYFRWPIALRVIRPIYPGAGWSWFTWHGWEMRTDDQGCKWFGWMYHLGPLKVIFGPRFPKWVQIRPPKLACPSCGVGFFEKRWQRDVREAVAHAEL
jgi:hypothetical protein